MEALDPSQSQRRPMTLCSRLSTWIGIEGKRRTTHHFESPDSSDPDFKGALDAIDVFEINAFPPATTSRFPPKEKKLLCHADSTGILITRISGTQACQSNRADDGLVGFTSTVSPSIFVVEATVIC